MVRQFIRHSLHRLSQYLNWPQGDQKSHHLALPQTSSLADEQRSTVYAQELLPSSSTPVEQPSEDNAVQTTNPNKPIPPLLPNPAANRAVNRSNFKISLSDYTYSPSSAVQSLSHQLAHPNPLQSDGKQGQRLTTQVKPGPIAPFNHGRELPFSGSGTTTFQSLETHPRQTKTSQTLFSISSADPITTEQLPTAINHTLTPISISTEAGPEVVTKTGVVKLLFKFKKNNHHGYIAPDDGSKDIIFHKKYIGNDVFSQLERGMAVEVTAHITEGKAYAETVRIL